LTCSYQSERQSCSADSANLARYVMVKDGERGAGLLQTSTLLRLPEHVEERNSEPSNPSYPHASPTSLHSKTGKGEPSTSRSQTLPTPKRRRANHPTRSTHTLPPPHSREERTIHQPFPHAPHSKETKSEPSNPSYPHAPPPHSTTKIRARLQQEACACTAFLTPRSTEFDSANFSEIPSWVAAVRIKHSCIGSAHQALSLGVQVYRWCHATLPVVKRRCVVPTNGRKFTYPTSVNGPVRLEERIKFPL
jgi:hypothetical protein